jgi:hypothetical protein
MSEVLNQPVVSTPELKIKEGTLWSFPPSFI